MEIYNIEKLIYFAEGKLINLLKEYNLKYMHSDIAPNEKVDFNKAIQTTIYKNCKDIHFKVMFDEIKKPSRGKSLEDMADEIKCDIPVPVIESDGIIFQYPISVLIEEYNSKTENENVKIVENETFENDVNSDNERLLSDKDLEQIKAIANKYNMSMADLGKMLSRRKMTLPRFQITCTDEEYEIIKRKADEKVLSLSQYCQKNFSIAIMPENIEKLNLMEIYTEFRKSKAKRVDRKRITVILNDNDEFVKVKEISKKWNIPLSSFMRYVALNCNF